MRPSPQHWLIYEAMGAVIAANRNVRPAKQALVTSDPEMGHIASLMNLDAIV